MRYELQYVIAWLNAAVLAVAGVLSASGLVFHPAWLTDDLRATAGILTLVCGALAVLLPQVTRTPAVREAKYLTAMAGVLPDDIANKPGLSVTRDGDHIDVQTPEKPLDTI